MAKRIEGVSLFPLKAGQKLNKFELETVLLMLDSDNILKTLKRIVKKPKEGPKIVEKTSKLKYFTKMQPETDI